MATTEDSFTKESSETSRLSARHAEQKDARSLSLARFQARSGVLGPGVRAVAWVQGCALRCRGCVVPESHDRSVGERISIEALAERLLGDEQLDGLTLSGGEPFLQAAALARLIDLLRTGVPTFSVMAYSGYRLETLKSRGSYAQRQLLARLDILIDGPFIASRQAPLRWRGSSNQRIHTLTARHAEELRDLSDAPAGIEYDLAGDGALSWTGVPAIPDFREELELALRGSGLLVEHEPPGPPGGQRQTGADSGADAVQQ